MLRKSIGCCGLDCEKCDAFIATKNNDDELREKTAKLWTELNGVEIKKEDINCEGCRFDGKKTFFCSNLCEIRKCALGKSFDTCAKCKEYEKCDKLKAIADNNEDAFKTIQKESDTASAFPISMCLGLFAGWIIGTITDNVPVWTPIGLLWGIVLSPAIGKRIKRRK